MSGAKPERLNWMRAIAWGCFLACSWTWVIGMFLPVYLIRDFGVLGWVAFAIPNVAGAVLVGWIWRGSGQSERFSARHAGAMRLFSAVTILFHVTFLGYVLPLTSLVIFDDYAYGAVTNGVVLIAAMFLAGLGSRGFLVFAAIVYALSMGAVIGASLTSWGSQLQVPRVEGGQGVVALALASPALAMGFLLCPHLDLTIHRARQEAPGRTGTAAFMIGFGVLFLLLIAFTLFYAEGMLTRNQSLYVIAHIAVQSLFTMAAHMRELLEHGVLFTRAGSDPDQAQRRRRGSIEAGVITLSLVMAILLGIALTEDWMPSPAIDGMSSREMVYSSFLLMYGFVFPAWLWICVLMGRDATRAVRAVGFAGAMIVAGPLFAWGHLGRRYVFVALAVGVVLIVGWAVGRRAGPTDAAPK